jgi:uncharacterized coiled-coil protein SlyX
MSKAQIITNLENRILELENTLTQREEKITELNTKLITRSREIVEKERKNERWEKIHKESYQRHRSQLMSIYYLLDAMTKAGTHREKANIIMIHKAVIEDLINKGDTLPIELNDEFPF